MTVTFFGHRDTPYTVQPMLQKVLAELIENRGADKFYVGNHGNFDMMTARTLELLKEKYPHIEYAVVLAYMPSVSKESRVDDAETVFPFALHGVPYAYAIPARNRWMIQRADTVITYVTRPTGGAEKFRQFAQRSGKCIINLAEPIKNVDE